MLRRRGRRGHPCLVPDLNGKASDFPPFRMRLAVGFLYQVEEVLLYFCFLRGFIMSNAVSAFIDMVISFLFFKSFFFLLTSLLEYNCFTMVC